MKYVAFLDVLGFKQLLKKYTQEQSENFIASLSSLLYRVWEERRAQESENIRGYIVSDSIIVYTENCSSDALKELIGYIIEVCNRAFVEQSILFRCGIAKGSFNHLKSYSFDNLQKGLIVGQAYVNAYLLEGKSKISALILEKSVADDIVEHTNYTVTHINKGSNESQYVLKWADIDLLLNNNNLVNYVRIAAESDWLPHYYNTLYSFMYKSENGNKQNQVFENILEILSDQNRTQNYRDINKFIESVFSDDVQYEFRQMFLKFLRGKLFIK